MKGSHRRAARLTTKMWITKFGKHKTKYYIYNMNITKKNSNQMIHRGNKHWLKYKYGCIYNNKMQYFLHLQAAKNFQQKIHNQIKNTTLCNK